MTRTPLTALLASLWLVGASHVLADDTQPAEKAADTSAVTDKQLDQWIRDLDSDSFNARQDATKHLVNAGEAAIPKIVQAAGKGSLEVATRAIGVLKELLKVDPTEKAARKALEKLTKSDNRSVARRAAEALKPEEKADPNAPQIIGGPGGIRIQVQGGGAARVIQIQAQANGNGQKKIEVQEDGKKISIDEDAGGIEMKVTEKVNGKEETKTYKAKDADDLKKKHPEAYKLYEKYANHKGPQVIRNLPIRPIIGGVPQFQRGGANAKARAQLKEAQKQLDSARERLKELAEKSAGDDFKKIQDQLEKLREQLEQVGRQIGK